MDTDNTQDGAEPSPASSGSQPVAWAVVQSERWSIFGDLLEANRYAASGLGELVPLYRSPTLSETEREAVEQAIDAGYGMEDAEPWALETLRELLKRLG